MTGLLAGQLESLREVVGIACESNPFQQAKLNGTELTPDFASIEDFLASCPFTTKDELARDRLEYPPYGTNLSFPLERYTRFHQTSGTKGEPMAWLDLPEDWDWMLGNWGRVLDSAGVESGARCHFAFSFGPFLGFWTAFDAASGRGCLCMPGGGMSSEQRLRSILEHKAEYLFCTPTYALHLAEVAAERGIEIASSRIRKIIVAGEPGGSMGELRRRISKAWGGVEMFDHYGMTEVGPVAYETPGGQGGLRVISESYLAEVVCPTSGETLGEGQQGELVLTTLGRAGCPVLRYRTGDLVLPHWGEGANGLPTLDLAGGILGRVDDMILVRGVNLYPTSEAAGERRGENIADN
ncbi:MAG: AMP-binding protein [Verrucomicrobia bacterium]|nr:AMP-binding protein [Verrucomicrobiota bacterium]